MLKNWYALIYVKYRGFSHIVSLNVSNSSLKFCGIISKTAGWLFIWWVLPPLIKSWGQWLVLWDSVASRRVCVWMNSGLKMTSVRCGNRALPKMDFRNLSSLNILYNFLHSPSEQIKENKPAIIFTCRYLLNRVYWMQVLELVFILHIIIYLPFKQKLQALW